MAATLEKVIHILTGSVRKPNDPHIPKSDPDNDNLHYGICPKDNSYLRKKGKNAFCKRCGYTRSRALILAGRKK